MPGERFADPLGGAVRGASLAARPGPGAVGAPFYSGEIADRGPIERPATPVLEPRARELRELERQRAWAMQATRALNDYRADGVDDSQADDDDEGESLAGADGLAGLKVDSAARANRPGVVAPSADSHAGDQDDREDEDDDSDSEAEAGPAIRIRETDSILPTLRVLPHGVNRKRLEQAIKELRLPVIIARDSSEADVVMTLKAEYRQKTAGLREAEDRGLPIYVLKSNTIVQMGASLTSIFSLEIDPREAALREAEEAIGMVIHDSAPIELSPQNAYIRRLQHQMAERANLISRSRGREPYRRVRLYP